MANQRHSTYVSGFLNTAELKAEFLSSVVINLKNSLELVPAKATLVFEFVVVLQQFVVVYNSS